MIHQVSAAERFTFRRIFNFEREKAQTFILLFYQRRRQRQSAV